MSASADTAVLATGSVPVAAGTSGREKDPLSDADDEDELKLFVGGLSWTITDGISLSSPVSLTFNLIISPYARIYHTPPASYLRLRLFLSIDVLRAYLESRGESPVSVQVLRDRLTGRSRGFGFVLLRDVQAVERVLAASARGELVLDGRRIEVKRAVTRQAIMNASRKLFVGGLAQDVHENDFRAYWSRFGTLVECVVMKDRVTGRSRGFGFVSFSDDDAVERALAVPHSFSGKPVEVKVAEPKRATAVPLVPTPQAPASAYSAYAPTPLYYAPEAHHAASYLGASVDAMQLHAYLHALMLAQAQLQGVVAPVSPHSLNTAASAFVAPMESDATLPMYTAQDDLRAQDAATAAVVDYSAHTHVPTTMTMSSTRKHAVRHSSPAPVSRTRKKSDSADADESALAATVPPLSSMIGSGAGEAGAHASSLSTSASATPYQPRVRLSPVATPSTGGEGKGHSPRSSLVIKVTAATEKSPVGSARTSRSSSRLPAPIAPVGAASGEGASVASADAGAALSLSGAVSSAPLSAAPSVAEQRTTRALATNGKPRTYSSPARWRSDLVPWKQSDSGDASETILKYFRSPTSSPGTSSPPSSSDAEAMLTGDEEPYVPRYSRHSQHSQSSSHSHSRSLSHSLSYDDERTVDPQGYAHTRLSTASSTGAQ